ncbi:MAG: DNA N-6-adenine-methyltransferase [Gammaproteobacteria bacterium]|nr:DNA N-6-adenine-methyltransferase [Gammaproteobacteria bacterium]
MTAGRSNSASLSHDWCTPRKYVDAISYFFGGTIALDPCSNEHSIVNATTEFSLPHSDGLVENWDFSTVFVNPPYGRDRLRNTSIRDWLAKCSQSHARYDSEILALVPVATNTRHWKDHVFGVATAVSFLYDTRLKFSVNGSDTSKGAPMSCAMIYWGVNYKRFEEVFLRFGAVVDLRHLKGKRIGSFDEPLFDFVEQSALNRQSNSRTRRPD